MLNTTLAPPTTVRRGDAHVNAALDQIVGEARWLTTSQLADLIAASGVIGEVDSVNAGPVGLWVVDELQRRNIAAASSHARGAGLTIYDEERFVIGEIPMPAHSTLYELEGEIEDGARPELVWQGEGDPR